jgi:copper transport protein
LRVRRRLSIWIALCLLLIATAIPSAAHANLIDSVPRANSTLASAPQTLELVFTEPLEPAFIRLTLLDASGSARRLDDLQIAPHTPNIVRAAFPNGLRDGLYTVSWRVVSAADGHATEGAYTLTVGRTLFGSAQPSASQPPVTASVALSAVAVRWLNLLSLSLLIGGLGFALWVAPEGVSRRWLFAGWLLAGLGGALMLLNQGAVVADAALFSAESLSGAGQVIGGTAYGWAWWGRMAAWGLIGAVLWRGGGKRAWMLALGLGVAMVFAHALNSHAAARVDHPEAVLFDVLHVLAAALWIGGLAAFLNALWRGRNNPQLPVSATLMTLRFSAVARLCVLALAVSGLYSAWLHVGGLEPLGATSYGLALTLKNLLFIAMLLLAAVNLFLTAPALKAGKPGWVGLLRWLIALELLLAGGVLLGSAWMTSDAPAGEAYRFQQAAARPVVPASTNIFEMQILDDRMIHFSAEPGTVGENTFNLTLFNADGTPLDDASRVSLRFIHLDNQVGESVLQADSQGYGTYSAVGSNLSVPGAWRVRLSVRQPGQFDIVTDFDLTIP